MALDLLIGVCEHCSDYTVWRSNTLVYPDRTEAPPLNPDAPAEIRLDYEEASNILTRSPRGAAALLRLCVQKLCKHFGEEGKNINDDIGGLVKKGLPPRIQKSLDLVRVVGNNAVHPGSFDVRDDLETAAKLFPIINLIIDSMISTPKQIDALFDKIVPEGTKAAIEKRDRT